MKNKRILFTIRPHSFIDVITNSSTELFVGSANAKDELITLIKNVYPDYLNEYDELKSIDEIDFEELDTYFSYYCSPNMWPATKDMYLVLPGFTFEELYTAESDKPVWNGEIQYTLKRNEGYNFISMSNFEEMKNKLDPERKMYFLFSLDDNPNWDMQEKLMNIMTRYHLG